MNKIEKTVYDLVKNSPALKFAIRNVYQAAFDLMPTPKNVMAGEIKCAADCFYGFHDRSPFSDDESMVLANHTSLSTRMPHVDEPLEVGYVPLSPDGTMGDFVKVGESYAWNFHKGCRLQWLGKHSAVFVFNTACDGKPITKLMDITGMERGTLPVAIDTVSDDGQRATSFSYERLHVLMPGYGYEGVTDGGCLDENAPESTGLSVVDVSTGKVEMIVSLSRLCKMVEGEDVSGYKHFVTHTEFSRDGRYISFLHRWIGDDYRRRFSRLGVYDCQTGNIRFMPTTGMVSHYVWNGRNEIVAYCSVKEGDAHVLFNAETGEYTPLCLGRLNMDGHQSWISDTEFVTDTYPDRRRMASLFKVDAANQTYERIAYLYSPRRFQTKDFHQHIACDLHPRMSPSGRFVCFDSVYTGTRSLCVMPLVK